MEKWPNFFIVGAPKTGTTSLHQFLKSMPEIYMSPVKEPNYFSTSTISTEHPIAPIRNKKKYLDLFKNAKNEKILGESSPRYLSDSNAPLLIHQVVPSAKILISLRDPVERVFSHYLHHIHKLKTSFHDQFLIESKNISLEDNDTPKIVDVEPYTENVKRYFDVFGKKQVKVIIFEEWITNTKKTVENILKFLNVDVRSDKLKTETHNPFSKPRGEISKFILNSNEVSKIANRLIPYSTKEFFLTKILFARATKPKMKQDDRDFLKKYYQKDVEKLKEFLGRDLPWKNFS